MTHDLIATPTLARTGLRRANAVSCGLLLGTTLLVGLLAGCSKPGFPHYSNNFREYAYIANGGSDTVTVVDVKNLRQDRVIAVGIDPVSLATNPVRNEVYVVNTGSADRSQNKPGSVSVIDTETNQVVATIPVGLAPQSIEVGPDGKRAYVPNRGSNSVSVLDLEHRRQIATIAVGQQPVEARISHDDKTLAVVNQASGSVSLIDPQTLAVRSSFSGCAGASDVVILPDSSKAFVACTDKRQVMALALAEQPSKEHPERHKRPDQELALLEVGQNPTQLALKPDGGEIFVSNFGSDTVSEIDTSTNEVGGAYLVGAHPAYGIVGNDDSTLWVSNFNSGTIGVYSILDGRLVHTVQVGDGPTALAFSSNNFWLFAIDTNSNDLAIIRTQAYTPQGETIAGEMFTLLPTGKHPNAIVVKTFLANP